MGGDMRATLPYGSWPSPVDAALAAAHDGRPEYVGFVGDELWWTEPRPQEDGRRALVRRRASDGPAGSTQESVLPRPWNVRSRVIEYGGQPWAGAARPQGPLVVFVDFADQRLYAYEPDTPGASPRPLTPVSPVGDGLRWADPQIHLAPGEVWCVMEEFTGQGPTDVRRAVVAVPLDGSAAKDRSAVRELSDDRHRFVTGPRLSPEGRRAVWLAWDHPLMPWDGTELKIADVGADGRFGPARTVIGGPGESVAQVEWAADGTLIAATDRTGWWNLHRVDPEDGTAVALCPREEEFGGPLWKIGQRWFAPMDNGLIAAVHGRGSTALGIVDPATSDVVDAAGPWTEWTPALGAHGSRVVGIAAGPRSAYEIVELDTGTGHARVVAAEHHDAIDPAFHSPPSSRTFTGPDGRDIHAHVHPPHHPHHSAPDDELPPYVIRAHGGPTGHAPLVLDLETAYFTTRGIGVVDVDYGGSTGYGRAYRNRLRGQWGIVDVEDCAAVALALAAEGAADPDRLAISGGSAGGWTGAVSLATTDVYACGTISYPILDLAGWAEGETHDFESQYLASLVGEPSEVRRRSQECSPIELTDRIAAPFLLLQGLDDVICPPAQCDRFLARMAGSGVPHSYLAFEGEGHGFRRADTMIRALEGELALYARTFGFEAPGVPALDLREIVE